MSNQEAGQPQIVEPGVVNAMMTEFYELLPYPKCEARKVSTEDIDLGEAIALNLTKMRISLGEKFTKKEMRALPYANLVKIAKSFDINTEVEGENGPEPRPVEELIDELRGKPKSLRPNRQIGETFRRLRYAREKIGYHMTEK